MVDSFEISCWISTCTLPSKILFTCLSLTCVLHPHNLRAQNRLPQKRHECLIKQYSLFYANRERVKICKNSKSPYNQFSFSILSLFLRPKAGLNYTRKDVDQKRILNSLCAALRRLSNIYLSISMTTMPRLSSSLYIAPTNNEKGTDQCQEKKYLKNDVKPNTFQLSTTYIAMK